MKVAYLKSENFKNILKIEIEFDGKSAILSGKNGSGKSSVIDAIYTTLTGMGTVKEPVKKGKESGSNTVHISIDKEIKVNENIILPAGTVLIAKREFNRDGKNVLKVSTESGVKFSKPKELLDTILGLTLIPDPTELVSMKPADQKKFVMDFLQINTTDIDNRLDTQNQIIYDKGVLLTAAQKDIPATMPDVVKEPEIDEDQAMAIKLEHEAYNKKTSILDSKITVHEGGITSKEMSIKETESEIKRLREKLEAQNNDLVEKRKAIASLKEEKEKLEKPRKTADELFVISKEQEDYKKYKQEVDKINQARDKVKQLSSDVDSAKAAKADLNKQKQEMLSKNLPVEGLTFSEEGLLYNDLPITPMQMSQAQQYELWLDILFAFHPNLSLVAFKNASLFDEETQQRIENKIADNGYIAIYEKVANNSDIQVHLIETSTNEEKPNDGGNSGNSDQSAGD